jgi:hypothetical protein
MYAGVYLSHFFFRKCTWQTASSQGNALTSLVASQTRCHQCERTPELVVNRMVISNRIATKITWSLELWGKHHRTTILETMFCILFYFLGPQNSVNSLRTPHHPVGPQDYLTHTAVPFDPSQKLGAFAKGNRKRIKKQNKYIHIIYNIHNPHKKDTQTSSRPWPHWDRVLDRPKFRIVSELPDVAAYTGHSGKARRWEATLKPRVSGAVHGFSIHTWL